MAAKPLIAVIVIACMWDHDTIRMEREVFPGVHEILAGKFVRHSTAYYEWRIKDRTARLRENPGDLALTDDLAVAYEKTGRTKEAIALMRQSLARDPQRYETLANLGTFLLHDGQLEDGLAFIRKAIEVNPDAHFGREIVQARVVEYVLACRPEGRVRFPLCVGWMEKVAGHEVNEDRAVRSGSAFVRYWWAENPEAEVPDNDTLVRGLTGMMFFGNHDSPVLAECLGDTLLAGRHLRLACRAYLKASYHVPDEEAAARYREMAGGAIGAQTRGGLVGRITNDSIGLDGVEALFKEELEEGREFFAAIEADEKAWVAAGLDLDEQFAAKYYEVGRTEDLSLPINWETVVWLILGAGVVVLVVRAVRRGEISSRRRRRAS